MKTQVLNRISKFLLAFSLIFVISCSNDTIDSELDNSNPTLFELLNTEANSNTAKNGPNTPGDDPIALIAINGGFTELVDALNYVDEELDAGLVDLFLNGKDQFTVFAPNDTAFENLYTALNIENIRDLDAELVLDVLLYHVTDGRRASFSVVPKKNYRYIDSLLGAQFKVGSDLGIVAIGNTANIVSPDINASNGIIHVIDTVILPIMVN